MSNKSKMNNTFLTALFLLSTVIGCSQDKSNLLFKGDTIFKRISADSLQISVNTFRKSQESKTVNESIQWKGLIISDSLKQEMNLGIHASHALGKIILDFKKNIVGYLVGCDDFKVRLYVYSLENKNFTFNTELASYEYVETAYEKIRNSWIVDLNGDGNLDIMTWEKRTDFEFPNELSDNISSDKKFIHFLIDTNFEYKDWADVDVKHLTLTK